eukprot:CAMPEP_0172194870 /NCGR_PEP_ID=MMETSP1050-20130122/25856_1 /TAXON_ID=233186 /ORGANISM="Cryptomonas curvata, Strain CCAP979/52" /LENGTH=97 /DNA_ID=CAMNT_0012870797 /DNA_START=265 /DNA_END=554 /DNA_ORIENTATION=+
MPSNRINDVFNAMIVMMKGLLSRAGRAFNSIMSRIRIHVENCFAGQHNTFNFLSFAPALKLGGRSTARKYVVANFLMNVLTTFNGNQFSTATGMRPP